MEEILTVLRSPEALSSAVSAATADAVSILLLFPVDSIKLKMQADSSLSATEIIKEVLETGDLKIMYKGIEGKLIQGPQQKMQYFYAYSIMTQLYKSKTGSSIIPTSTALLLGYLSALQSLSVSLPLEVCTTRVVCSADKTGKRASFFATFKDIVMNEGFFTFYRTMYASALICVNPAVTYAAFERLKVIVMKRTQGKKALTTFEAFIVGAIAKAFATILTFPAIRTRVIQNTWSKQVEKARKNGIDIPKSPGGFVETVSYIVRQEGYKGLYSGLTPALIKGVSNAAIMLALKERIYEVVNRMLLRKKQM
mmetsp:Transcript_5199/g.6033  ORF Transcript_5199/g.6033 Transcript_5199/m.6033 type:complete len:310 (+) Transcript_5199:318-1247(+)|eukprot:CAMPEP_0184049774 /NCGR_PEP_ID=MMETSP0956-20121227/3634_1 /TAXON_ID=627963 /ORGANISM="Aplanochytrium sp, Strain PBS07" /LENGTH=309 /DNA_ID=CAMNT_0026342177 /DNA_START=218 /DNA_END=1147 /DNA_ORIENTATION=+